MLVSSSENESIRVDKYDVKEVNARNCRKATVVGKFMR